MVEVIYPAFKYVMLNMVKFIKTSTLIKYYQTFKKMGTSCRYFNPAKTPISNFTTNAKVKNTYTQSCTME